jgi:hypothetical protein
MNHTRVNSRGVRGYSDVFLMWPLLISSLVAGGLLFSQQPRDRVNGAKCAALAVAILLAARRRLLLVIGVIAFLASRLIVSVHRPTDWRIDMAAYIFGAVVLWGLGRLHESRSFRHMIRDDVDASFPELTLVDLLVNLAGLLSILSVLYWILH